MIQNKLLATIGVLLLLAWSPCRADWAEKEDPGLVRLKPANGSVVKQNPPGFSWIRVPGASTYELSVRGPAGFAALWHSQRNWYLPSMALQPGNYVWKVRTLTPLGPWSSERSYLIDSSASVFNVPAEAQLISSIKSKPSPRALGGVDEDLASWVARTRRDKQAAISTLENQVRAYAKNPLVSEQSVLLIPRTQSDKLWVDSLTRIRQRTQAESRQIRSAAILWRLTGNVLYRDEAIRRGDALAELDPYGSTSHVGQDQGNRAIAWGLTVAFDYLADDLHAAKKTAWLGSIRSRTASILDDLKAGGWRLEQHPLDSHGSTNIGYVAAISAILIDKIPEAEDWFRNTFRSYANYLSPWGDDEGGFGNGSAYAEYSTWYFVDSWDAIAATTGVNLYDKPWSKGLLRFLACFAPPGSPTHAFGDGAETKPDAQTLKAFARRFDDSWASWYAHNLIGKEDPLSEITNPVSSNHVSGIAPPPNTNACFFKHIGWAAMHSQLGDRSRTSVYFKSSRYGSFNHSHGDQNSFVVVAGGRPLLTDSGVYDWYGSPQWSGWYRKTVAHNAITFDGGQGQVVEGDSASSNAQGQITRFTSSGNIDFAEGDATKAYGGALNSAIRRIWYLRGESAVLVWDKLDSAVARTFEWNMHAAVPLQADPDGNVEIQNQDQSVCIIPLLRDGISFKKRQNPIGKAGVSEDHAYFQTLQKIKKGEFLILLDIGCRKPKVSVRTIASGQEVSIGDSRINILSQTR